MAHTKSTNTPSTNDYLTTSFVSSARGAARGSISSRHVCRENFNSGEKISYGRWPWMFSNSPLYFCVAWARGPSLKCAHKLQLLIVQFAGLRTVRIFWSGSFLKLTHSQTEEIPIRRQHTRRYTNSTHWHPHRHTNKLNGTKRVPLNYLSSKKIIHEIVSPIGDLPSLMQKSSLYLRSFLKYLHEDTSLTEKLVLEEKEHYPVHILTDRISAQKILCERGSKDNLSCRRDKKSCKQFD
jgi:hypothetical protein